jgi:predicted nuclease of predicted toxin-antitoxin system
MKFLLDQNLSAAAAEILRADGMDVFHAREVGLATADDRDILIWCREKGRISTLQPTILPRGLP